MQAINRVLRVAEQPQTNHYNVLSLDIDEIARAKQEAADIATLENILQLSTIDSTDDGEDELLTDTG